VDRQLFFCSTIISIGDGRNTPFGEARWLDGLAPKDLAPDLYQVARFKRRTMHTEMQNDSWIRIFRTSAPQNGWRNSFFYSWQFQKCIFPTIGMKFSGNGQ
jgi:hypothetical protein